GVTTNTGWQAHDTNFCASPNKWYFVVAWENNQTKNYGLYINGINQFTLSFTGNIIPASGFNIGLFSYQGAYFPGDIADVQIYNTSLSTSDIQTLYQEGIGGVPIDLNYLVAWYPLNGNADDYSGNNNNGQINNVIFTTSWQNGYTSP
ncbi:MAG: LamG-like jellyroll fold domain-containing protein, partial [Candidatus Micrarchaeia archaeon]